MDAFPIVLTFKPDRAEIDALLERVPARKAGNRALAHRLSSVDFMGDDAELWLPIRLTVDGYDLFRCPRHRHPMIETIGTTESKWLDAGHRPACPWRWLPIVDLAMNGLACIHWAMTFGNSIYQFASQRTPIIVFEAKAEGLLRITTVAGTAIAPADIVQKAWERFADEVRGWLTAELPELRKHREVGRWLMGETSAIQK